MKLYINKTSKGYTLHIDTKRQSNTIREYTVFDPYLVREALARRFKYNRKGGYTFARINPKWIDELLQTPETIQNLIEYYYF